MYSTNCSILCEMLSEENMEEANARICFQRKARRVMKHKTATKTVDRKATVDMRHHEKIILRGLSSVSVSELLLI